MLKSEGIHPCAARGTVCTIRLRANSTNQVPPHGNEGGELVDA